jgi:hypothetical protein
MVNLTNPVPTNPSQGNPFSIDADGGVGPYSFIWRVDDQENNLVNQDEKTLRIPVPEGSMGESLFIQVTDGRGDTDNDSWTILAAGGGMEAEM